MATVYSDKRYNGDGTCWWRIRVDYNDTTATAYVDVGPSGWSIWLRFTTGTNTFTKSANIYYASNNGGDSNKLGSTSIDKYTTNTITQTCSGSDWGGTVNGESSAIVPRQATPPAPTCSASVSSIGTDRATYTAQMTNNPYGYWRIHIYDSNGNWKSYSTAVNTPCSFTQTGLAHNTSYSFSYRYSNSSDGEISNPVYSSFTTSGNAPVINSVTPSPSRTSCSLANNSISYDTNASLSTVTVRYGTTSSYGSTSSSSNLTGLMPNTTYYYSMTVKYNWNRTSNAVTGSFKTTGNAPSITRIYNLPRIGVGEFNADVTYDTNAAFSSIEVQYGTTTNYGETSNSWRIPPYPYENLNHNTLYYYRFRITDTQGHTSSWATSSMTITGNAPSFSDITINKISSTSVEVTPSTITYDNASYQKTNIQVLLNGTSVFNEDYTATPVGLVVYGLTPGQTYDFKVKVQDNFNKWSSIVTQTFDLTSYVVKVKVNGSWVDAKPYVKVGGTWKEATPYIKVSGTWTHFLYTDYCSVCQHKHVSVRPHKCIVNFITS